MVGLFLQNMSDPFAKHEAGQDYVDYTQFDGARAFDTMGFADSEGAANGRAGTQEVDGNKLEEKELMREKREKRDKTNELMELGAQLRQSRSESITVGGISLSIEEWKNIRDTLDDPAKLTLLREQMRAEGKTDAEIAESEYLAGMASDIAIKKHTGETLTSEEQAFEKKLENDPVAQQQIEHYAELSQVTVDRRLESDRSASESQNAASESIDDTVKRNQHITDAADNSEIVEIASSSRLSKSVGDNPFADTRSISSDFNSRASDIVIAEIAPQNITEAQINTPILSNG